MADNIIIKITTEADLDAAQKQLQALTDKMKQQEKVVRELSDQEKQDADNIRQMVAERDKLNKALAENQRYYREEKQVKKDEVAATKASIKELEKQVKAYKTLQGTGGTMVKQLRAMREELQRMEDAGQFGTKAFMDLSIAAGKLEDQIGDTQARIRVLSSDTIGLDTAMGVADGLSGTFYVATSAAEVFGNDLDALQEAFYRVQAAMSVVSGVQQIANTINKDSVVSVVAQTAAAKLRERAEAKVAVATAASTAATGAQTIVTKLATKAQIGLNAAIAASPLGWLIGIIAVAAAAVAGLVFGVYKLWEAFSDRGQAMKQFREASKELENIQRENAVGQAIRAQQQQELLRKQSDAQEEELRKAEARNASEIEMAQLSLRHAKEKHDAIVRYNNDELARNQKEINKLAAMVDAKQRQVASYRDGSRKQKKAMEELTEVEQQYADALQKTADLETEKQDAWEAEQQAAEALKQARKQMRLDAEQANIELMREGAAKEIAQIKFNYREQLKEVQGNSREEIALRKALLEKQAKEIAEVQRKYALQAQETAILDQKNLLAAMSQYSGTEADYANQIALTKKIAEAEAKARIDALDQQVLGEKEYKAQVESIRLELANTLRDIDEQEVQRLNENAKRETEILLTEAEARANALSGKEDVEHQKAVWNEYYNARKEQIIQNTAFEIEAINRSTDTEEVKEQKKTQILAEALAEREALEREAADKTKEIDDEYIQLLQEKMQAIADTFSAVADFMQQASDLAFEAISSNIQAQMDALDEMYTTDAQEAKENANKKYISEKELAEKKAALEQKQAKYNKAQALINAAINTAQAIVATLAQMGATPWGIASSVIAGTMGAAQMAIIASKPLAQYAKGRKGGKGEYALVGEKGPEVMYVPEGASIVPNHYLGDMDAWSKFGVPALPNDMMLQALNIDYDRLGKAVAANIPQQKAVSVNVDRNGVTISDNGNRRTYLNHKYSGSWS
jgi:Sec-independent protein translocase protein TatA